MLVPTTSEGRRSEVNWMRWNEQWKEFASAWASVVLPTPGTSSTSRCPLASIATMARRMTSSLPRMTRAIELCNCAIWFAVAVVIGLKILVASVTNIGCGLYFYVEHLNRSVEPARIIFSSWAISSVVRALASHARGPRFKSLIAHHVHSILPSFHGHLKTLAGYLCSKSGNT